MTSARPNATSRRGRPARDSWRAEHRRRPPLTGSWPPLGEQLAAAQSAVAAAEEAWLALAAEADVPRPRPRYPVAFAGGVLRAQGGWAKSGQATGGLASMATSSHCRTCGRPPARSRPARTRTTCRATDALPDASMRRHRVEAGRVAICTRLESSSVPTPPAVDRRSTYTESSTAGRRPPAPCTATARRTRPPSPGSSGRTTAAIAEKAPSAAVIHRCWSTAIGGRGRSARGGGDLTVVDLAGSLRHRPGSPAAASRSPSGPCPRRPSVVLKALQSVVVDLPRALDVPRLVAGRTACFRANALLAQSVEQRHGKA